MTREVNGVSFTFFETPYGQGPNGNVTNMYSIQFNTDFPTATFTQCGYQIVNVPQNVNDILKIKLFIGPGNSSHVVHDFEIGQFPNGIEQWGFEVEYIDPQGTPKKEVKTEQAEAEAEPRPIRTGVLR